jgi:hypothetical protein
MPDTATQVAAATAKVLAFILARRAVLLLQVTR